MPRPTLVAVATQESGALSSSITLTKPASATALRAWLVLIETVSDRTFTTPSGWIAIGTHGARVAAFIRICDGSEGSTQQFLWTGGLANCRGISSTWDNVDPTTPITIGGAWVAQTSGTSVAASAVTDPGWSNDLLVSAAAIINATNVMTKPASMTQTFQSNSPATLALASEPSVAGSTGTRTWTWTGTAYGAALLFVLKGIQPKESMGMLRA